MTLRSSRILSVLLAFLLLVTSAHVAVARVGMSLQGTIVLCMGAEIVVLPLGADGRPQDHGHLCPDCVMGSLALPAEPDMIAPPTRFVVLHSIFAETAAPPVALHAPSARAPPMHLL